MRSTINNKVWLAVAMVLALASCRGKEQAGAPIPFTPYAVTDSSAILTYPDGLRLYVVSPGPGDYPVNGTKVQMHYQGRLDDGTVFDDSYARGEAFEFSVGSGKVITGIDETVKRLRLGSKAIAWIPPSMGYGDGNAAKNGNKKSGLPPKIPANARLTFHLDLIGTF